MEVSAALLARVWVEQGEPGLVRFRVLALTRGRATQVVAKGESRELLLTAVLERIDTLIGSPEAERPRFGASG